MLNIKYQGKKVLLCFMLLLQSVTLRASTENNNFEKVAETAWHLIENGNFKDAIQLYLPYANKGNIDAQNGVAIAYENLKNATQTLYWYTQAANGGSVRAMFNLGRIYDRRYGNPLSLQQSDEQAISYYAYALSQDKDNVARGYSALNLAIVLYDNNRLSDMQNVLECAVKESLEEEKCPYLLAKYFYKDDDSKAFRLYRVAAEKGNSNAQYKMGFYFENGILVDKDLKEAVKWYQRSSDNGNWNAQQKLGESYERLWRKTLDDRDLKQAIKYYYKCYSDDNDSGMPRIIDLGNAMRDDNGVYHSYSPLQRLYDENVLNAKEYDTYEKWEQGVAKILAVDSDVDINIPLCSNNNGKHSFVLIIANEDYIDAPYVPYATNDGNTFYKYCIQTLGIPEANISLVNNATLNKMKKEVGLIVEKSRLNKASNLIVYYSGHGIPAEDLSTSYLLPTDAYPKDPTTGYNLAELYTQIDKVDCNRIVFLDACFSGTAKNADILVEGRGVAIKAPKLSPVGKTVVISACSGSETAMPYNEQKHGLFTYFLLKKLQLDHGSGTSLGGLFDFIQQNVEASSVSVNNKRQTPTANFPNTFPLWRNIVL